MTLVSGGAALTHEFSIMMLPDALSVIESNRQSITSDFFIATL
jgi:hypothetical protein